MMLDEGVAAVLSATTYRILSKAFLLTCWFKLSSGKKNNGFNLTDKVHEHWYIDIKRENTHCNFLILIASHDGCSCYILQFEFNSSFQANENEIILNSTLAKFPVNCIYIIPDYIPIFISSKYYSHSFFEDPNAYILLSHA